MTPQEQKVAEAIKKLRGHLEQSQQEFSNRIGVTVRTVARYEGSRPPRGTILLRLADIAAKAGRRELADVFREAEKIESASRHSPVAAAIRRLRSELGDTQQKFAERAGLAVSTIARAETSIVPDEGVLEKLQKIAKDRNLPDIEAVLEGAKVPARLGQKSARGSRRETESNEEIRAVLWLIDGIDDDSRGSLRAFLVNAIRSVIAKRGSPLHESEIERLGDLGRAAIAAEPMHPSEQPLPENSDVAGIIWNLHRGESLSTREVSKILQVPVEFVERFVDHMTLVKPIAERIHQAAAALELELNDLINEGMKGLFAAVTKMPPGDNVAFSHYAEYRIRGAILDNLRKQSRKHAIPPNREDAPVPVGNLHDRKPE